MLNAEQAVLIVVDVQGKLAGLMHRREELFENLSKLIRGAAVLGLPTIVTEQNPDRLGPTINEIAPLLPGERIAKMAFSCRGEPAFNDALAATGRRQVLLCGIEAHICVYQTCRDLLAGGVDVYVVADAIGSRNPDHRDIAVAAMRDLGARVTCVEMALFEMLRVAGTDTFRQVLKIIR